MSEAKYQEGGREAGVCHERRVGTSECDYSHASGWRAGTWTPRPTQDQYRAPRACTREFQLLHSAFKCHSTVDAFVFTRFRF